MAKIDEISVLALWRDGHHFVFFFYTHQREQVLRQIGAFASDPDITLSWHDAAVLARKLREHTD